VTFATTALITGDGNRRARCCSDAWRAYATVLRFMKRIVLRRQERVALEESLMRLQAMILEI
jgi:hypothetical protein